jgi:hypothetical protein
MNHAWHFVGENRAMQFSGAPVRVGETVGVEGALEMCVHGPHASERLIDALTYAPGPILCLVRLDGDILRTVEWMGDIGTELRQFACLCALDVAHLWDIPEIVREYLETGDESLRAAALAATPAATRAAVAWDAVAWVVAAREAAWAAAAREAAWAAAARVAAQDAARKAFRAATQAAAQAAATRAAAWDAAAWLAAWDTTWAATRDGQNIRLSSMVMARIASEITP